MVACRPKDLYLLKTDSISDL